MNRTVKLSLGLTLATATILAGCGREAEDRGAMDDSQAKHADARPVSLTGCVSTGTGTNEYMLTNVRFAPLGEQPSDAQSYAGTGITEHSQVRLADDDDERLRELVGQVASVTGSLRDDGRNTIGTSGPAAGPADAEPQSDVSKAATDQHHSKKVAEEAGPIGTRSMNNGTFPEIVVQRVSGTGEKCPTIPTTDRR